MQHAAVSSSIYLSAHLLLVLSTGTYEYSTWTSTRINKPYCSKSTGVPVLYVQYKYSTHSLQYSVRYEYKYTRVLACRHGIKYRLNDRGGSYMRPTGHMQIGTRPLEVTLLLSREYRYSGYMYCNLTILGGTDSYSTSTIPGTVRVQYTGN